MHEQNPNISGTQLPNGYFKNFSSISESNIFHLRLQWAISIPTTVIPMRASGEKHKILKICSILLGKRLRQTDRHCILRIPHLYSIINQFLYGASERNSNPKPKLISEQYQFTTFIRKLILSMKDKYNWRYNDAKSKLTSMEIW